MIISFNFFQRIDWISLNNKFLFYNKLQTNHYGYFQFNLCNVDGAEGDATQECFDKTPLLDINGNKKMLFEKTFTGKLSFQMKLPNDVSCTHFVFQWIWNAGNNWGTDSATGEQGMGLEKQEQYRSCADITISSNGGSKVTQATQTTTLVSNTGNFFASVNFFVSLLPLKIIIFKTITYKIQSRQLGWKQLGLEM